MNLDSECFHCHRSLLEGEVVTVVRGIGGLLKASVARKDGLDVIFKEMQETNGSITAHVDCRKAYIRPSTISKDCNANDTSTECLPDSCFRLRSSLDPFWIETDCLFCGKEASLKVETKKHMKYRRVVHEVTTLPFKDHVLMHADARHDDWGETVRARILSAIDLVAAEAKYHQDCHLRFFTLGLAQTEEMKDKGRPEDPEKAKAFAKLCDFILESDECQFSMSELEDVMGAEAVYSRAHLKDKLERHFGDSIYITELPRKSSVLNLKGKANAILYEKWYAERKADPSEEKIRIVEAAAKILLEDIRRKVYDIDNFPPPDYDLADDALLPDTLRCLLSHLIKSKSSTDDSVRRKRAAVGQALVSACRPRSFVPPILLAVGVFVHRHYESKEFVKKLSKLSFSVDYNEVRRYEYSALEAETARQALFCLEFRHYGFDNADINLRTLTGHGTFHTMGEVRFREAAFGALPLLKFHRVQNPPSASSIGARGTIPVSWFKMPSKPGLKAISVRELQSIGDATSRSVAKSLRLDALCLAGLWAGAPSPPSWNGFMRTVMSKSGDLQVCSATQIEALPFINLSATDPSTIFTSIKFAENECKKMGQKICLITYDLPLFVKASEIVSASSPDLENVVVRLGGFHLLMSFMGSIGFIMSGSGLEELWCEVYAKASVAHMLSGHAYARAIRAHFLTETALTSLLLDQTEGLEVSKHLILSASLEALNGSTTPEELADLECIKKLHEAVQEKRHLVCEDNRTAQLWSQYLEMVEIVRLFIRAERTSKWDMPLYCVRKMLPYFHAAGHFAYAKAAHLYLQTMEDLEEKLPLNEFQKFIVEGFFSVHRKTEKWSGIWSDMSIEQDLMRPLKVQGGLNHGRSTTDSSLAYFVLSFSACLGICNALETVTGTML